MRRLLASLTVLCAVVVPVAAQEPAKPPKTEPARASEPLKLAPNVMVSITVGNDAGKKAGRRTYRMVARDGEQAELLMGWRTPIPTASQSADGDDGAVTSYTYQNVGVTAKLSVRIVPDGRVMVEGQIEVSGAREEHESGPPTIGTFQQALQVLMKEGAPLRVAEVPDPEDGTLYLELDVDVLD
jgi:hypothetical protein